MICALSGVSPQARMDQAGPEARSNTLAVTRRHQRCSPTECAHTLERYAGAGSKYREQTGRVGEVHARGADSAWTGATEDLSGAGMAALLEPGESPAGVGDVIEADLTINGDRVCVRALVVAAEAICGSSSSGAAPRSSAVASARRTWTRATKS